MDHRKDLSFYTHPNLPELFWDGLNTPEEIDQLAKYFGYPTFANQQGVKFVYGVYQLWPLTNDQYYQLQNSLEDFVPKINYYPKR